MRTVAVNSRWDRRPVCYFECGTVNNKKCWKEFCDIYFPSNSQVSLQVNNHVCVAVIVMVPSDTYSMICSYWSIFLPIVFWHEVIIFRVLFEQIIINRLKVYGSVYVCTWLVIMKLLFPIQCFPYKKFQDTKFAHVWCQIFFF